MATFDAVFVGLTILDIAGRPVVAIPPRGGVAFIEQIRLNPAGTAAGANINAAKLGIRTAAVACLGEDEKADFILASYARLGIDCSLIQRTTCILKDGENGSWLIGRDGGPQHIAPWPVEAVDTTGCGDSYCGGFIAALARGLSVKAACDVASAVAALVATGMGSDAGVVDWEQTQAFMAAHRP